MSRSASAEVVYYLPRLESISSKTEKTRRRVHTQG
uniref:Uncharacterized protein n=1 Tax=Anguilla anguilla TaxID=7936 RepID=A0A0E9V717_ANGAN